MLTFAYPWLLALIVLPLLLPWLLPAYRQTNTGVVVPFLGRLAALMGQQPAPGAVVVRPPLIQQVSLWAVWLCIVLALGRPQWLEKPITKTLPTRDLLLAVDLSGSMETQDFTNASGQRVDRLTAVKEVLDDFLAGRKGDRVRLIFFGSSAFVQAPFTEDLDACRSLLDEAQVRMAGPKTAFGDAIGLAISVFAHEEGIRDRVLIALTDGNDTGSQVPPTRAAEISRDRKITIHSVAVGDPTAAGEEKLDETTLRAVAATTGGQYSHANDRAALAEIYAQLDALRTREVQTISHRPRRELFCWPLGVGMLLSLAYHLMCAVRTSLRRKLVLPATAVAPVRLAAVISGMSGLSQFHFLRPWWLLAMVPALWLAWMIRRRQDAARPWRGVIADHLLAHLLAEGGPRRRLQPMHLLLSIWLLATLALSGPTWQRQPAPLDKAADTLDATLTIVSPDDRDVRWLARHTETSLVTASAEQSGERWKDAGYWLVFGVAALALMWFRPGWMVQWQ
jgi:Ca-activated chloride channel family protein